MATALARDFDETPPDTLPLAALSLTTDIRAPDTSNIERPLTLLSIPKDIRLLIWDEVFTEIQYTTYPWCRKCRSRQNETGHKKSRFPKGKRCTGSMLWMSQPWPKQTSPIFISRKLYDETLSHFQRTPIFHHKRGWGFIQLPERISNKLQTIKFGGDHLECLGQGEPFEVNALIFPKLKTVILTQKPVKIDCSPSISNNIRRFLHDKALCTGDEGNPSHGGLCESFVTLPLTYQAPSNPTVYTEMEKRRVEHTKKVIETRDIKIKFPLTYDIKVVTSREKEKAVWWKRFETTAVWEKRGLTLPSNSLPDLSKEWWFGRWKTYREGGDDPEMPYDGRKGRFLLQSSYQWGDFQEV